ncbi:MAG: transcriptional regulator [Acholeplasmatales bacterium]|nr:MAG: transcriptional regulator [Acholeplasmatales bacterium]
MDRMEIMKQLGNETRLRLVVLLLGRELCVCELEEILGERQVNITKHLNKLKEAGIVTVRREKQRGFHTVSAGLLAETALIEYLRVLRARVARLVEDEAHFHRHEAIKDQHIYVCNMYKKETLT